MGKEKKKDEKGIEMRRDDIRTLTDLFIYTAERESHEMFSFRRGKDTVHVMSEQFRKDVLQAGYIIKARCDEQSKVVLMGPNSYSYIVNYFAIVFCGSIPVLVDKDMDHNNLLRIMEATEASLVIFDDEYLDSMDSIPADTMSFNELAELTCDLMIEHCRTDPEGICTIFHSSSTTGEPKIIPLTHRNIVAEAIGYRSLSDINGTAILCIPMHHVFGMIVNVLCCIYYDLTVFINDSLRRLVSDIKSIQPSMLMLVPGMYSMLMRALKGDNTPEALRNLIGPNLTYVCFGGAAFSEKPSLLTDAGVALLCGYGLTETAASITLNVVTDAMDDLDNVGIPMEGIEIRFSDIGEIEVKGDMVFPSYIGDDKLNEESFSDGFYRTGDIGYMDKDGNIHVTGKIKNLIILPNGENIPGEKLEALMYDLTYIQECVVKDVDGRITALIYSEYMDDLKERLEEDLKVINKKLPLNHNITGYILRDEPFPKTSSGKIRRVNLNI